MSGTHDLPRPKMWRRGSPSTYEGGVCRSDDGGRTWKVTTEGMTPTAATHILLDRRSPSTARVLYVAGFGRGVFKSSDGGMTWALKNNGLPAKEPFAWRLSQDRQGVLYLVIARRSDDGSLGTDGDGGLYRSRTAQKTGRRSTCRRGQWPERPCDRSIGHEPALPGGMEEETTRNRLPAEGSFSRQTAGQTGAVRFPRTNTSMMSPSTQATRACFTRAASSLGLALNRQGRIVAADQGLQFQVGPPRDP